MAIRTEIPDRIPIENVEVEYDRVGAAKRPMKPGFNRVRLLDIDEGMLELATREGFAKKGEKLELAMHVKGVKDFVRLMGEVSAPSVRINVFKQPAYAVTLKLDKLSDEQSAKLNWARDQLAPKKRGPIRRPDEAEPASGASNAPSSVSHAGHTAASSTTSSTVAEKPPETKTRTSAVKRPVALLELIDALDKLQITPDLIEAVIEAAESGVDVEGLAAETEKPEAAPVTAYEPAPQHMPTEGGTARLMPVYRLSTTTKLHFSENNLPTGPASELLYLSRLHAPESCFAVALELDSMTNHGGLPSFRKGSILVFSTTEKLENGDFALVRSRGNEEFAQVFWEKGEEVRIRPLNPQYPERVARRLEIKNMFKLIGQYVDMTLP